MMLILGFTYLYEIDAVFEVVNDLLISTPLFGGKIPFGSRTDDKERLQYRWLPILFLLAQVKVGFVGGEGESYVELSAYVLGEPQEERGGYVVRGIDKV
jgi:hypothetical protein